MHLISSDLQSLPPLSLFPFDVLKTSLIRDFPSWFTTSLNCSLFPLPAEIFVVTVSRGAAPLGLLKCWTGTSPISGLVFYSSCPDLFPDATSLAAGWPLWPVTHTAVTRGTETTARWLSAGHQLSPWSHLSPLPVHPELLVFLNDVLEEYVLAGLLVGCSGGWGVRLRSDSVPHFVVPFVRSWPASSGAGSVGISHVVWSVPFGSRRSLWGRGEDMG